MNNQNYYSAIAEYKKFNKLEAKKQYKIKKNILFELFYAGSVLVIFITGCYIFQVIA